MADPVYMKKGPFVNQAAPAIDATFLNDLETFLDALETEIALRLTQNAAGLGLVSEVCYGTTITIRKDPTTGFWPASYDSAGRPVFTGGSASAGVRPTASADVIVVWKGPEPSPAIVASGTGGMLDNVDVRDIEP